MPVDEAERAALSQRRGRVAAGISDPKERQKFVSRQGDEEAKGGGDVGYAKVSEETRGEENRQALADVLGSKKKGGPIKKTGLYKLHEGENVETAKEVKAKKSHPPSRVFYH